MQMFALNKKHLTKQSRAHCALYFASYCITALHYWRNKFFCSCSYSINTKATGIRKAREKECHTQTSSFRGGRASQRRSIPVLSCTISMHWWSNRSCRPIERKAHLCCDRVFHPCIQKTDNGWAFLRHVEDISPACTVAKHCPRTSQNCGIVPNLPDNQQELLNINTVQEVGEISQHGRTHT